MNLFRFRKSHKMIIMILILVISLGFPVKYKIHEIKAFISGKPLLKVSVINQFANQFGEGVPFIWEVLNEKYYLKLVKNDYDVLFIGPLSDTPIPEKSDKYVKIYNTWEVHLGDLKARLKDSDLVVGFDLLDEPNYIRLSYAYNWFGNNIRHDYSRPNKDCNPSEKKKFACFLTRNGGEGPYDFNGAILRNRLFHKLSLYKHVDSGGPYLNNTNGKIPYKLTSEWLSHCKFTISYENNVTHPGYITEKPFKAWLAGSIPLYNSARESLIDINKNAILYAKDFSSEDEFIDYIIKVDNDDELYCSIWNQNIVTNPEMDYENAKIKLRAKMEETVLPKLRKIKESN